MAEVNNGVKTPRCMETSVKRSSICKGQRGLYDERKDSPDKYSYPEAILAKLAPYSSGRFHR